jgi:hypothetical protein
LAELARVVIRIVLGDARALLGSVFHLLRARR